MKKNHHCNTSVIYLVQNLFPKNKESRTISLNSQYIVVFKNPRDVSQMTTLAKQMYPGRVKFVQEAFANATSTLYWYNLVALKQDTPEDLRLRNYRSWEPARSIPSTNHTLHHRGFISGLSCLPLHRLKTTS